jgi:preprotein translocase subunit SecY
MSAEISAVARRAGLAGGFSDGPSGGAEPAEIWRRLCFTLVALIVYRLGGYIPMPGLDPQGMRELLGLGTGGILGLLDMFAGGATLRFSLFALGIMPYVSAFIIVQLVGAIVPGLRRLAGEGPAGRRAVNQYARLLALALAGLQAFGVASGLEAMPGLVAAPDILFKATTVLTLAAGTIFLMWLAEQITERGIGDGALLILACGIVGRLPFGVSMLFEMVRTGELEGYWPLPVLLLTAAVVALVVVVERAMRWIPVTDPGGAADVGAAGGDAHLPLKLNPTGILAPLAAAVLTAPLWDIARSLGGREASWLEDLARSGVGYALVEGLLIFFFAVVFGLAAFDPEQIAAKPKETDGSLAGFRPGEDSNRRLRRTQTVLAFAGALYLLAVCVLPDLIYRGFRLLAPVHGFQLFLLAWLLLRVLDRVRPLLRP